MDWPTQHYLLKLAELVRLNSRLLAEDISERQNCNRVDHWFNVLFNHIPDEHLFNAYWDAWLKATNGDDLAPEIILQIYLLRKQNEIIQIETVQ